MPEAPEEEPEQTANGAGFVVTKEHRRFTEFCDCGARKLGFAS
jgi:hypothetical protein